MTNCFFTLQKESERRLKLASLMQEHENEVFIDYLKAKKKIPFSIQIIEKWWKQFLDEIDSAEVLITNEIMHKLLNDLRIYLAGKDNDFLQSKIQQINTDINPYCEIALINQLKIALYIFPNAVCCILFYN